MSGEGDKRRLRVATILRAAAAIVLLAGGSIILVLPGTTSCPPRDPNEYDPLPCSYSALSPSRFLVLVVGALIAVVLWMIAFVQDTD